MKFFNKIISISVLTISLSSCGLVYLPAKNEGIVITESQISQIKEGLTLEQVNFILGNPSLFTLASENTTLYFIQRETDSRNNTSQKSFFVKFLNNKVTEYGYK